MESLRKEIENLKQEYLRKSIELIKKNKEKIFSIALLDSFHTNDPFEGDSSTTYYSGYLRIVDEQENGRLIVRLVHDDIVVRNNHIYPNQEALNYCKHYIRFKNWTGYGWSSLVDLIGDVVEDDKLLPFFKDILYSDDELVGYMVNTEDIEKNIKPWLK